MKNVKFCRSRLAWLKTTKPELFQDENTPVVLSQVKESEMGINLSKYRRCISERGLRCLFRPMAFVAVVTIITCLYVAPVETTSDHPPSVTVSQVSNPVTTSI